MRTFVISDLHGNNQLFKKALKTVGLKKSDELIILGDCIDRGNDAKGVLDTILVLLNDGFNLTCLRGNHEEMFLNSLEDLNSFNHWIINGGDKTLSSFLTSSIDKIPEYYVQLIRGFKYYHATENFIFVHAALNMNIDNPFQDVHSMLWARDAQTLYNEKWLGNKKLLHGHQPLPIEEIRKSVINKSPIIGIDNGVCLEKEEFGNICVLEVNTLTLTLLKNEN